MSSSPSPSYLKRSVRSIVFPRYLSLRFAAIDRAGKSREKKRGEKAEEWISGIDVSLDARCENAYHPTKFYRCRKSEVTVFQAVVHTGQASQIFTLIFWDSLVPRATLFPPRWTRNFVGDGFSRERRFQQRWKEDCVCEKEEKRRSFLLIIIIRVVSTIISNFVSYSFYLCDNDNVYFSALQEYETLFHRGYKCFFQVNGWKRKIAKKGLVKNA